MPTDPWVREPLTENELTDARDKASALTGDLSPLEEQWLRYLATIDQLEADLKSATNSYREARSEAYRLGDALVMSEEELERHQRFISWLEDACADELPHSEIIAAVNRLKEKS